MSAEQGKVVSIHRVEKRDAPAQALEAAGFIADFALEGDWRSRSGRSIPVRTWW
jgi:hypothetical protein